MGPSVSLRFLPLALLCSTLLILLQPTTANHHRNAKQLVVSTKEYGEGFTEGTSLPQGPVGAFAPLGAAPPRPLDVDKTPLTFLQPFVDALPVPAVIRVDLTPNITMAAWKVRHKFHRDLPSTWVYAYGQTETSATVPGPTLLAARGVPVHVAWENRILDRAHILPVDYTTGAAKPALGFVPMVAHLHGSVSESASDGHPQAWFTAYGDVGPTYVKQTYTYPNTQPGATMWYHDHTVGMTRLNVKAGLYGLYVLRDGKKEAELSLPQNEFDIPLALSDSNFHGDGVLAYPTDAEDSLYHLYWRPENFGRFPIVNGKIAPFLEVQRALYRFRLLNSASSRFFNLSLCVTHANITQWAESQATNSTTCTEDDTRSRNPAHGIAEAPSQDQNCSKPTNSVNGGAPNIAGALNCSSFLPMMLVASDAGFLPNGVTMSQLLVGSANRKEVLVDFSNLDTGASVVMINTAPIPFPNGGQESMYPLEHVMLFRPAPGVGTKLENPSPVPDFFQPLPELNITKAVNYPTGRNISLTEYYDMYGNVIGDLLEGRRFLDQWTLTPQMGTAEIWNYINLTPDAHPVHFHFLPQRIIERRVLDVQAFAANKCSFDTGECFKGAPLPPAADEVGLYDTIIVYPRGITRVLVDFGDQERSLDFDPTSGPGYVIHCHILDHEDMDMMRPVRMVNPSPQAAQTKSQGRNLTVRGSIWTLIVLLSIMCS